MPELSLSLPEQKFINALCSAFRAFKKAVIQTMTALLHAISDVLVKYQKIPGRIRHLARYGKNRRIRKKNISRIMKEWGRLYVRH